MRPTLCRRWRHCSQARGRASFALGLARNSGAHYLPLQARIVGNGFGGLLPGLALPLICHDKRQGQDRVDTIHVNSDSHYKRLVVFSPIVNLMATIIRMK